MSWIFRNPDLGRHDVRLDGSRRRVATTSALLVSPGQRMAGNRKVRVAIVSRQSTCQTIRFDRKYIKNIVKKWKYLVGRSDNVQYQLCNYCNTITWIESWFSLAFSCVINSLFSLYYLPVFCKWLVCENLNWFLIFNYWFYSSRPHNRRISVNDIKHARLN